jgi:SpoVK/Ycf46/Vps4 family AAA+-type ATPase
MITSQYLGETAKNVEKTFEVAKRLSPCILFIDEFDFVAKTRASDEHAAIKRAVNTLLKSIDEVSLIRDEVLLIGARTTPTSSTRRPGGGSTKSSTSPNPTRRCEPTSSASSPGRWRLSTSTRRNSRT